MSLLNRLEAQLKICKDKLDTVGIKLYSEAVDKERARLKRQGY